MVIQKAELITKAIGEKVENLLVVGIKRMILSEVQFVEIRRQETNRYGIKYPLDITGTASSLVTISKDLFPGNFAQGSMGANGIGSSSFAIGFQNNDGYGRLLAQPKLVCASGEKAEFLAGGEVPIPLITNNQDGKYKKEVYVLPKSLDEKVARLHLAKIGVKLTELRKDQADYIGVKQEGPFKSDHYRY